MFNLWKQGLPNIHDDSMSKNITYLQKNLKGEHTWKRTTKAVGGYTEGSFVIEGVMPQTLIYMFENWIGHIIRERNYGSTTWEGFIHTLDLILDGVNYRITMDTKWFHNMCKIVFTDSSTDEQSETVWEIDAQSRATYGDVELIMIEGKMDSDTAQHLAAQHISQFSFPRSRIVGGVSFGNRQQIRNMLVVKCTGFWETLKWQMESEEKVGYIDALIEDIVGDAQFITLGTTDTNEMATYQDCGISEKTYEELLREFIEQGDAEGNVWTGGVYGDREFDWREAATEAKYVIKEQSLQYISGGQVNLPTLRPGILIKSTGLQGYNFGETNDWDNSDVAYIDEVQFASPDTYQLRIYREEESIFILKEQIKAGIF
jgi:hypothetical protein